MELKSDELRLSNKTVNKVNKINDKFNMIPPLRLFRIKTHISLCKSPILKSDFIKTVMDRCISVEFPNIKFCKNLFSNFRVVTVGQTYGQTRGEKNRRDFTTYCYFFYLFEYWGVESILGPLGTAVTTGLLYLPRVSVRMEKLVEWTVLAGETKVFGENLPPRHFAHHKSHLPDPGANPGRCGGKPATNPFSYGAASAFCCEHTRISNTTTENQIRGINHNTTLNRLQCSLRSVTIKNTNEN
jgi:hypothetical protein